MTSRIAPVVSGASSPSGEASPPTAPHDNAFVDADGHLVPHTPAQTSASPSPITGARSHSVSRPVMVVTGLAVVLQLLDLVSTLVGLAQGHPELNPLVAGLLDRVGVAGLVGFKAIVIALIVGNVATLPRRQQWVIAVGATALGVATLASNVIHLFGI